MKLRHCFLAAFLAAAVSAPAIDSFQLRVQAYLVTNSVDPELLWNMENAGFNGAPGSMGISYWSTNAIGVDRPEDEDLPSLGEAETIMDDYYDNPVFAAEPTVSKLVLSPSNALPDGVDAAIPRWTLKKNRTTGLYDFQSDAYLASNWTYQAEYSNVAARVAAVASIGSFSLAYGSGYNTNAAVGESVLNPLSDLWPAFNEATATNNATTNTVRDAAHALAQVIRFQSAGGALTNAFFLETTNCPWLSTGPYRNP